MKVRSLFLGLLVTALCCSPALFSFSAAPTPDTNEEPSVPPPPAANETVQAKPEATTNANVATNAANGDSVTNAIIVTNTVNTAELEELRTKLDALQHANDLALGRWAALLDQNNSLSNVLSSLQQTLTNERRREVELSEEARKFNGRVMLGAAGAIFLVFLASYWFQLRCLNRVMELSNTSRELP